MKKFLFTTAIIAALSFTACSSDDDSSDENPCVNCSITLLGVVNNTEYCDNGDGTYDVTSGGQTQTATLPQGVDFNNFLNSLEASGQDCDR